MQRPDIEDRASEAQLFGDLRKRNERRAHLSRIRQRQRELRSRSIERALQARRERRFGGTG